VNSKVVLRKYKKTAHTVFTKHSLFGCGYQISLNVLQLQILIQCCKLAQKIYIKLHILNTFNWIFQNTNKHYTEKCVKKRVYTLIDLLPVVQECFV